MTPRFLTKAFWTRFKVITAVLIVLVIVAGAAGATMAMGSGAKSDPVSSRKAPDPSGQQVAQGISILLPSHQDPTSWKFTATSASPASIAAYSRVKFESLATTLDYHAAKPVPAGTKIIFHVRKDVKTPVFEAYYDPDSNSWVPEPTTYKPATGVAIATVAHFSIHDLFTWPASVVAGVVNNLFGDKTIGKPQPVCGSTNGVWMYFIGGANSVRSCHSATIVESPSIGKPGTADITVKLTNNHNEPIDVAYPSFGSADVTSSGSVAAQIGAELSKIASSPSGKKLVLVPAGATATVTLPGVHPPFSHLSITTQVDGEAYAVGLLSSALDEVGLLANFPVSDQVQTFMKGFSGEQALYRIASELTVTNLSPAELKTITDVTLDAFLVVAEKTLAAKKIALVKLVISYFESEVQATQAVIDYWTGNAYHKFTFAPYGTTWNKVTATDLHSVDWGSVVVPGWWFKGPDVTLSHGAASGIVTKIPVSPGLPTTESLDANISSVVYGTLAGKPVAALNVDVNVGSGGTADSVLVEGWVIYGATPTGGVEALWPITPRHGQINAWTPYPPTVNPSYISSLVFHGGLVTANEVYYNPGDTTAGPSGRATTTWGRNGSSLVSSS